MHSSRGGLTHPAPLHPPAPQVVATLYSNRAAVGLRLRRYEQVVSDTWRAQDLLRISGLSENGRPGVGAASPAPPLNRASHRLPARTSCLPQRRRVLPVPAVVASTGAMLPVLDKARARRAAASTVLGSVLAAQCEHTKLLENNRTVNREPDKLAARALSQCYVPPVRCAAGAGGRGGGAAVQPCARACGSTA